MRSHKPDILFLFICLFSLLHAQKPNLQELVNRKQFAVVSAFADSLTPADSADYQTMYAIGQAYEGLLRYKEAYGVYQHCLLMDTANADVLNTLARTAINLGRAVDAERYFHRVLDADSLNFYANYQLARLYYQLGDYEKAIAKYEKLQDQDGGNSTLWQNKGDCYTRMELLPAAALCYFQAYNTNRENAGLASALINIMLRLGGDYVAEALAICDTALCYNTGNRQLLRNKGMALYMSKRYSEADTLYSALMAEGDSTYFTFKYGGASMYYGGQYLKSVEPLEWAYEKDTNAVEVCLLLGSALGKTYDRKRAYTLLDKAEEGMRPDPLLSTQLLLFRAETYDKDARPKDASRLYYEGWKLYPERLNLLQRISFLYSAFDQEQYTDDDSRQRGLFIHYLYLTEHMKSDQDKRDIARCRPLLESFYQDAFFRSVSELPMRAPDGKKSMLSVVDLRALINSLPEIPEDMREYMDAMTKSAKKNKKENKLN